MKSKIEKITYKELLRKKKNNEKAVLVTAYDYSIASVVNDSLVDVVLVGDSASMVMMGNPSTLDICLDEMIVFGKSVRRAIKKQYLIFDMPFLTYQISKSEAIKNCGRALKETRSDAVKMEGGKEIIDRIKAVVDAGIPVCGHIGMKPQSYKKYGGYPILGNDEEEITQIIEDGLELQKAGVLMVIVENTTDLVVKFLKENLKIPVYSIGSGIDSDGQIVVINDIIGLYSRFTPRFIKRYENISKRIFDALNRYADDVKKGKFPQKNKIPKTDRKIFLNAVKKFKV
ncbi:MAG: 3-methyl-2-oxobutanoate hydroxymethyltransferase [candidate division WOR-3 bacterium]